MAARSGQTIRECYFAAEIERMLGMSAGNLYRKGELEKLYRKGFPESLTLGRYRFPKAKVDAFMAGRKPLPDPANDAAPLAPAGVEDWQRLLHSTYSQSR